jgi:hypothetical protein
MVLPMLGKGLTLSPLGRGRVGEGVRLQRITLRA